jgi:hypothetical protein
MQGLDRALIRALIKASIRASSLADCPAFLARRRTLRRAWAVLSEEGD